MEMAEQGHQTTGLPKDAGEARVREALNWTDQGGWPWPVYSAVVMAADNYPGKPRTGDAIEGLDVRHSLEVKVFHSATRDLDGRVVTAGGRVLTVCALGDTVTQAQRTAYEAVDSLAASRESEPASLAASETRSPKLTRASASGKPKSSCGASSVLRSRKGFSSSICSTSWLSSKVES